jgi:glycosyltransferase involved in cell wall biosynthesis
MLQWKVEHLSSRVKTSNKTILFIRSMPLDRDSRSLKMVAEYRRRGFLVLPVIWSRGDLVDPGLEYAAIYRGAGGYGRRLGNLWVRVKWICFLAIFIWKNRNRIDLIHSVDLDVGIITAPLGRLIGTPVVYDAFDQMASFFNPGLISRCLALVERYAINASSLAIFPDIVRLKQYGILYSSSTIIISNIPDIDSDESIAIGPQSNIGDNNGNIRLHLVYVGTLESTHRALEFIPRICDKFKNDLTFSVAGVGFLKNFFDVESNKRPNLKFYGKLAYFEAKALMADSDCLYAPYLLTTQAHKYASPNKMYEHLALGKPLLTNSGTPVGDLVSKEQSGYIFDGSYEDLVSSIEKMSRAECQQLGEKAMKTWQATYSQLRFNQINKYFTVLKDIYLFSRKG